MEEKNTTLTKTQETTSRDIDDTFTMIGNDHDEDNIHPNTTYTMEKYGRGQTMTFLCQNQ